ncbi:MAG: hypothetical protein JRJ66_12935 [Deltaproteobacteria bacterium]|nr:hypothetical protein [Deltaproteobacteria bacterium]
MKHFLERFDLLLKIVPFYCSVTYGEKPLTFQEAIVHSFENDPIPIPVSKKQPEPMVTVNIGGPILNEFETCKDLSEESSSTIT